MPIGRPTILATPGAAHASGACVPDPACPHSRLRRRLDAPVIGDIGKAIVAALSLGFLCCVILEDSGVTGFFADSYKREGFCLANQQLSPMYQGHALSFYMNSVLAVAMFALVALGRQTWRMSDAALRPVQKNAISLLAHGFGHGFLAMRAADIGSGSGGAPRYTSSGAFESLSLPGRCAASCALFFVWFGFMRDARRRLSTTIAFALLHDLLQVFVIPTRFFFTHVLMAVPLHSAARALLFRPRHQKDIYYPMEAWLVDVPILLMTFVEALSCDKFLIHYGGHAWFDAVVPVGFFAYYLLLIIESRVCFGVDARAKTR